MERYPWSRKRPRAHLLPTRKNSSEAVCIFCKLSIYCHGKVKTFATYRTLLEITRYGFLLEEPKPCWYCCIYTLLPPILISEQMLAVGYRRLWRHWAHRFDLVVLGASIAAYVVSLLPGNSAALYVDSHPCISDLFELPRAMVVLRCVPWYSYRSVGLFFYTVILVLVLSSKRKRLGIWGDLVHVRELFSFQTVVLFRRDLCRNIYAAVSP